MDHEGGSLGSLAHTQSCPPLPLRVLDLLPPSWCPWRPAEPLPPNASPDTAATLCAQVCPGACAQVWGGSGLGEAPSSISVHSGYQVHPGAEVATPWRSSLQRWLGQRPCGKGWCLAQLLHSGRDTGSPSDGWWQGNLAASGSFVSALSLRVGPVGTCEDLSTLTWQVSLCPRKFNTK